MITKIIHKRVFGMREGVSDVKLMEMFKDVELSHEVILEVLKIIGVCYGISYAKVRPQDCFITQLSKIDSWRLDVGAEKLEKWLLDKYRVTIKRGSKSFTVLDLLKLLEDHHRSIAPKSSL